VSVPISRGRGSSSFTPLFTIGGASLRSHVTMRVSPTDSAEAETEKTEESLMSCADPAKVDSAAADAAATDAVYPVATEHADAEHVNDGGGIGITVDAAPGDADVYSEVVDTGVGTPYGDGGSGKVENAMEVLLGPDGTIMFRFEGDEGGDKAEAPAMPADEAEALPDEPRNLIDQKGEKGAAAVEKVVDVEESGSPSLESEVARATASAEDAEGTVIRRRAKQGRGEQGANSGMAMVSKLGIKVLVEGIEGMFDTLKRAAAEIKKEEPVRLPRAHMDSPWNDGYVAPIAPDVVGAAFESFGGAWEVPFASTSEADSDKDEDGGEDGGESKEVEELLVLEEARSVQARLVEVVEGEHVSQEVAAQHALEEGCLKELNTPWPLPSPSSPEVANSGAGAGEEDADEVAGTETTALAAPTAQALYNTMGTIASGLWRPKPMDVTIGGKKYVAYITPRSVRQLTGGETAARAGEDRGDGEGGDEERPSDTSTIILCDIREDGSNVFMFGLTYCFGFPTGRSWLGCERRRPTRLGICVV